MCVIKPAVCIFFTPFFSAVYNQEWLILQTSYVIHKEMMGLKPAVCNQERFRIKNLQVIMVRGRCIVKCDLKEDLAVSGRQADKCFNDFR